MTSKNGSPPSASSAANTDSPLPSLNRSLRMHRTGTPRRTDNPAQNRSISSARYPTTTTSSSTPTSTRFRTARSNRATPATVTSGLTRPRGVRRRDPFPLAITSPRTTSPSKQAAATEPGSRHAAPPQARGTPKTYRRGAPGGQHLNDTEFTRVRAGPHAGARQLTWCRPPNDSATTNEHRSPRRVVLSDSQLGLHRAAMSVRRQADTLAHNPDRSTRLVRRAHQRHAKTNPSPPSRN